MEKVIVWYLRMSVVYFVAGAVIGFFMIVSPDVSGYYVTSHAHLNLLGFMSMMIYGVGYHILPRFSGRNIYSPKIMHVQFWLANAGLVGMAIGWPLQASGGASLILMIASLLSFASIMLFAVNILKTIKAA
ncbi:MAG: hypothetical protein C4538_00720 [Nitrospiraceae bacterium]|nr:MAG: hypothetical protein C4538_00720 [Nitrospiraceae bacterium]